MPPIINRILTLLTEQGFAAYVVGGAVRDLLLGKAPGDFDVATWARPESVISILEPAGFTVLANWDRTSVSLLCIGTPKW